MQELQLELFQSHVISWMERYANEVVKPDPEPDERDSIMDMHANSVASVRINEQVLLMSIT